MQDSKLLISSAYTVSRFLMIQFDKSQSFHVGSGDKAVFGLPETGLAIIPGFVHLH
jgi:hypothetical protein